MPEERSEKRNYNNAKDKAPRVAIKGLVLRGLNRSGLIGGSNS